MIYKILALIIGINLYASGVFDSYFTNPYADEKKDNGFLSLFEDNNKNQDNNKTEDLNVKFSDDNVSNNNIFSDEKVVKIAVLINKKYLFANITIFS